MRTVTIASLMLVVAIGAGAQEPAGRTTGTGSVAGTISTSDQHPLNGARIEARSGSRVVARVSGREDGVFRFDLLPPGSYTIVVTRIGYGPRTELVSVTAGSSASLRVVMSPSATQLNEVTTTASRRTEKILEAPASVSVVSTERITERPALSVMENVRALPGVDVAQGGLVQSAIVARADISIRLTAMGDRSDVDHACAVQPR